MTHNEELEIIRLIKEKGEKSDIEGVYTMDVMDDVIYLRHLSSSKNTQLKIRISTIVIVPHHKAYDATFDNKISRHYIIGIMTPSAQLFKSTILPDDEDESALNISTITNIPEIIDKLKKYSEQ